MNETIKTTTTTPEDAWPADVRNDLEAVWAHIHCMENTVRLLRGPAEYAHTLAQAGRFDAARDVLSTMSNKDGGWTGVDERGNLR